MTMFRYVQYVNFGLINHSLEKITATSPRVISSYFIYLNDMYPPPQQKTAVWGLFIQGFTIWLIPSFLLLVDQMKHVNGLLTHSNINPIYIYNYIDRYIYIYILQIYIIQIYIIYMSRLKLALSSFPNCRCCITQQYRLHRKNRPAFPLCETCSEGPSLELLQGGAPGYDQWPYVRPM